MVLAGRTKLRVSKNFFGGYLFVFVEYLCNRSPKIKTKNIKNYSSNLAIVNHRNWLDDSPPLNNKLCCYQLAGRAVTISTLEREVIDSYLGPVKSDTVLPIARHGCNISTKRAGLSGRNAVEMGPANSLYTRRHNTASIVKDLI